MTQSKQEKYYNTENGIKEGKFSLYAVEKLRVQALHAFAKDEKKKKKKKKNNIGTNHGI